MPLFICENCGCIDSTRCIQPNTDQTKINMTLEEMQGLGNRSIKILDLDGYQIELAKGELNRDIDPFSPTTPFEVDNFEPLEYKFADMTLMLCSECNTGTWHNQFEKLHPVKEMVEIANKSLYKYIDKEDNIDFVRDYINNYNKEKENV